jgi:hypothetical protein
MGTTLFRYIFFDLLKVFLLAAGALAWVMSFAGLLKPVSEHGLGPKQALTILLWLLPAMFAYALPVAALFATSFVYGRMSADNEATAAKAAGIPISIGGLLLPAAVLAAMLGGVNLALVSVVVPAANLQVERTIWSNLAALAANAINRTSRLNLLADNGSDVIVFARRAVLPPPDEDTPPNAQIIRLEDAHVVRYGSQDETGTRVPDEIYSAAAATVFIDPPYYVTGDDSGRPDGAGSVDAFAVTAVLEDGVKVPRRVIAGLDGNQNTPGGVTSVAAAGILQFGPIRHRLPVGLNPKSLSVQELRTLLVSPDQSHAVRGPLDTHAVGEQRRATLARLADEAAGGGALLDNLEGPALTLLAPNGGGQLFYDDLLFDRRVRLVERGRDPAGRVRTLEVSAATARITAEPLAADPDAADPAARAPRVLLLFDFENADVAVDGRVTRNRPFERRAVVPMDADLAQLASLPASAWLEAGAPQVVALGGSVPQHKMRGGLVYHIARQTGGAIGELHARAAFVGACLVLPIVGAGLGLVFRSGNFLTAFALSTIPAAVCLAGIFAGQEAMESGPFPTEEQISTPANIDAFLQPGIGGLLTIWGGVTLAAVGTGLLLMHLRNR